MNRHELEERLRTVERKLRFVMHSLAMTRTDNTSGQTESQTFDTLFNEAIDRGMDPTEVADMAQASIAQGQRRSVAPKASPPGSGTRTATYPDGFGGDDTPASTSDRDVHGRGASG